MTFGTENIRAATWLLTRMAYLDMLMRNHIIWGYIRNTAKLQPKDIQSILCSTPRHIRNVYSHAIQTWVWHLHVLNYKLNIYHGSSHGISWKGDGVLFTNKRIVTTSSFRYYCYVFLFSKRLFLYVRNHQSLQVWWTLDIYWSMMLHDSPHLSGIYYLAVTIYITKL